MPNCEKKCQTQEKTRTVLKHAYPFIYDLAMRSNEIKTVNKKKYYTQTLKINHNQPFSNSRDSDR